MLLRFDYSYWTCNLTLSKITDLCVSLVLILGSEWDNIYDVHLQVSQVTALPSESCALVWDSQTETRTMPHSRRASRSFPLGGETQSVLISGGCLKQGQSSLSLLINRPWCQVSYKSDLFQISSRVFSLLIQCLRYTFKTWFGKTANAPGQLSRWATTTDLECPRACDLH